MAEETTKQTAEETKQAAQKTNQSGGIPRVNLFMIVLSAIGFSGCVTAAFVLLGLETNWTLVIGLAAGTVVSAIILAIFLKFSKI